MRVYLSIPIGENHKIPEIEQAFHSQVSPVQEDFVEFDYWNGGHYGGQDQEISLNTNFLIVHLPANSWRAERHEITRGVISEIEYAVNSAIPIILAYKRRTDHQWGFYRAQCYMDGDNLSVITGVEGSSFRTMERVMDILDEEYQEYYSDVGKNENLTGAQIATRMAQEKLQAQKQMMQDKVNQNRARIVQEQKKNLTKFWW